MYEFQGVCPICARETTFRSQTNWFRDNLFCDGCAADYNGSIVRERGIAYALSLLNVDPGTLDVHEISPLARGISLKLQTTAKNYVATNYFPDQEPGKMIAGTLNQNAENQVLFEDETFDLCISLDVMEHVNQPELVISEIYRTLRTGGLCVFTTPTYKSLERTERRAFISDEGYEVVKGEPEWHGNPYSKDGSLVTFHFGYDLCSDIARWTDFNVLVLRFAAKDIGVMGEFTEVYVCKKGGLLETTSP